MISSVRVFTEKCVKGLEANQERLEGWLSRNPIIVTALNPLIGYAAGAALVKESSAREMTVRALALEKASAGMLIHRTENRPVTPQEIEDALLDLRQLTEGGIHGISAGG
jgi:fumarate hydratase class II